MSMVKYLAFYYSTVGFLEKLPSIMPLGTSGSGTQSINLSIFIPSILTEKNEIGRLEKGNKKRAIGKDNDFSHSGYSILFFWNCSTYEILFSNVPAFCCSFN